MDSNFIIKISEDFTCRKYQILSFKKIYNFIFNDTFYSMNQCKVIFNMKFGVIDNGNNEKEIKKIYHNEGIVQNI